MLLYEGLTRAYYRPTLMLAEVAMECDTRPVLLKTKIRGVEEVLEFFLMGQQRREHAKQHR